MSQWLPNAMSAYYLECRLAANAAQVDFATCVIAAEGGRRLLAGQWASAEGAGALWPQPHWQPIRNLFGCWANPTSLLFEHVPLIWLGFDNIAARYLETPLPCLSICLDPEHLVNLSAPRPVQFQAQQFLQCAETISTILLGQALPAQTRQQILASVALLPAAGKISYLSVMLGRQPQALKINGSIPKDKLSEYLTQLGWSGSLPELKRVVTSYGSFDERIRFDLTVSDTILPRLGFEIFARGSPQSALQQHHLVGLLITQGLCTPEKGEALLNWPGFSSESYRQQSWPTRLSRSWYAKIIYQPDQLLEAKCYLGFRPSFFSPFTLC
jgi:hypothetical protein